MGTSCSASPRDDTGRRRLQPRQRAQRAGRAPGGSRLEGAAREHERDDEDHRLVVHVGRDAARGEDGRRDGGDDRVEKRRASADRNQRVHVGGPVPQADPGADIELAARPAHRDRRDEQQRPRQDLRVDGVEPREDGLKRRRQPCHHPLHEGVGTGRVAVCRAGHQAASRRPSRKRRPVRWRWPCGATCGTRGSAPGRGRPARRRRRRWPLAAPPRTRCPESPGRAATER